MIIVEAIELAEMREIIGTLYEMEGLNKDSAKERGEKIFEQLDIDGDGELTEEEFIKGCLIDDDLVELIDCRKGVRDQMVEEDENETEES